MDGTCGWVDKLTAVSGRLKWCLSAANDSPQTSHPYGQPLGSFVCQRSSPESAIPCYSSASQAGKRRAAEDGDTKAVVSHRHTAASQPASQAVSQSPELSAHCPRLAPGYLQVVYLSSPPRLIYPYIGLWERWRDGATCQEACLTAEIWSGLPVTGVRIGGHQIACSLQGSQKPWRLLVGEDSHTYLPACLPTYQAYLDRLTKEAAPRRDKHRGEALGGVDGRLEAPG